MQIVSEHECQICHNESAESPCDPCKFREDIIYCAYDDCSAWAQLSSMYAEQYGETPDGWECVEYGGDTDTECDPIWIYRCPEHQQLLGVGL